MSFDLAPFGSLFSTPQKNGLTRPKSVRGSGVPMVNMNELFAFSRIHNIEMDLVPIVDKEAHFLLETEDLLFARQSLVLAGAGKCSIFIGNTKPTVFESHIIRCRLNKKISNPYFYYYFFQSVHGRTVMETIAEQGAGASGIRGSDLVKLLVPCPSKSYQDAIVKILTPLDNRISLLRETNTTLEAIAQTLFKSWFVDFDPIKAKAEGRLPEGMDEATTAQFPSEFEESALGLIPKGWRVGMLGNELKITYGKNLPTNKLLNYGFPVFGGNGQIGFFDKYIYEERQILISCRGAASGKVNQSLPKSFITNNSLVLETGKGKLMRFGYLKWLMKNSDLSVFVTGSAQPQVTIDNIKGFKMLLPDVPILDLYESISGDLEDRIEENEKQSQTLTTLRDTLLPRLISGQLRINQAQQIMGEVGA